MDDTSRTFNKRNELTQRIVTDSTGTNTYDLTYDLNGNLTSDDEKYDYVYNPFGQLVQVKFLGTIKVVANYTYNAFGHRISEQTDTNDLGNNGIPDGDTVNGSDPVFFIATDPQGRRVATYRDADSDSKESFLYHMPAGFGKTGAMGPILRTRNSSEQIPTNWATTSGSSTHDERYYYVSDFSGNIASIVRGGGNLIEQYRYSATGMPMGIPRGDVDSNGLVDGAVASDPDYDESDYLEKNKFYHVRADWDLDGDIDSVDTATVVSQNGIANGRLVMSAATVGNNMGLAKREFSDWYSWFSYRSCTAVGQKTPSFANCRSNWMLPLLSLDLIKQPSYAASFSGIWIRLVELWCCTSQDCDVVFCLKGNSLGDNAISEAERLYPGSGLRNGPGDAFRHCLWSCTMACDMTPKCAERIGNCHEDAGRRRGQPLDEESMDRFNNARGRFWGSTCAGVGGQICNTCCIEACQAEIRGNRLRIAPNGEEVPEGYEDPVPDYDRHN